MRYINNILLIPLVIAYALLFFLIAKADYIALQFNEPDAANRQRTGYNPHFHPGEYTTPENTPYLFPANAHLALAQQAANDGKIDSAKQHAYTALTASLANGAIGHMLFNLYTRPNFYLVQLPPKDPKTPFKPIDRRAYAHLSPQEIKTVEILAKINLYNRPTYIITHATLHDYWLKQQDIKKASQHWPLLITLSRTHQKTLFPKLYQLLLSPVLAQDFEKYMKSPPKWWNRFFKFLIKTDSDPEKIQYLISQRLIHSQTITPYEKRLYISYLKKRDQWYQAKSIWDKTTTTPPSLLQNGNFEDNLKAKGLFDWKIATADEIDIQQAHTKGSNGNYSLLISLNRENFSLKFKHILQYLVLLPGKYQLTGRYKLNNLETPEGLTWRIRCNNKSKTLLGETQSFRGYSHTWINFQTNFTIPKKHCKSQIIRLESTSKLDHKNTFSGEAWFDDLKIKQYEPIL